MMKTREQPCELLCLVGALSSTSPTASLILPESGNEIADSKLFVLDPKVLIALASRRRSTTRALTRACRDMLSLYLKKNYKQSQINTGGTRNYHIVKQQHI
jgi:hypothetical protein